jgi:hypothetical protein
VTVQRRRVLRKGGAIVALLAVAPGTVMVGAKTGRPLPRADAQAYYRASHALPARLLLNASGQRIPPSFEGLSIESSELLRYARASAAFDQVTGLLRTRGGRMLLRVGGSSADRTWWQTTRQRPPRGVSTIGASWIAGLKSLSRRDHLRVLLDLNLAVHAPVLEAKLAAAAARALLPSTLAGVEVGNEPNLYPYQPWLDRQRTATSERRLALDWTQRYSPHTYREDYRNYAIAIRHKLSGVPLAGPNTTNPDPAWLSAVAGLGNLSPLFLSIHRYGLSTCWPKWSSGYATIRRLLTERSTEGLARSVRFAAMFAHQNGMRLQLTELNAVSCGGKHRVADSFATALWALDALFELTRAGVDGVNWHLRPNTPNAPFQLTTTGIRPLPELYGLVLFAQIAAHGELMRTDLISAPGLHLKAWAVRHGRALTVVLIDKGARPAAVTMPVPAATATPATLRSLRAPSVGSVRGVRYAGRWMGSDGRWRGREVTVRVHPRGGVYRIHVPPGSAITLTIESRPLLRRHRLPPATRPKARSPAGARCVGASSTAGS